MKHDYYMHKSKGYVGDYFGEVGEPFKVSFSKYCFFKSLKYRVTKVPKGTSICEVIKQAISNHWMANNSYSANKLRKKYCNE
jgi:hypothetical protein